MAHYIDKFALVAEIERRIKYDEMVINHDTQITELLSRELNTLYELSSFIKSLEVKEVELSWEDISAIISIDQQVCGKMGIRDYVHNHQKAMEEVLKRFKAQKGESV